MLFRWSLCTVLLCRCEFIFTEALQKCRTWAFPEVFTGSVFNSVLIACETTKPSSALVHMESADRRGAINFFFTLIAVAAPRIMKLAE